MRRAFATALFFAALPLAAQTSDEISFQRTFLLRNVAGTASNPGPVPHHPHLRHRGDWTFFHEGTAFVTYSSETGPVEQRNEVFSTNWFAGGAQRAIGHRGLMIFKGRVSLEPFTIKEDGYPQILQFVSRESGGPLLDRMRAHDLIGEAAAQFAFRTSTTSFVHLYAGAVGNPALGPVPYAQRASAEEFAEAPLAYDVQESFHQATRVVTAGFGSRIVSVEGSVFHHSVSTGRHATIEDGNIDSWSGRLTVNPTRNLSMQLSTGKLGDADQEVMSGSISYGTETLWTSAIWTQRQLTPAVELASFGFELAFRFANRNTVMGRVEAVDRPYDRVTNLPDIERTAHYGVGYLFDFLIPNGYRLGAGINIDYHTDTKEIEHRPQYGHKPQSIYVFLRFRTDAATR